MNPVETYLTSLHASPGAGTPETSGYPALSNLLNAIRETLKPKEWISYRESALPGRLLTSDEAQQFTHHVRRIVSILGRHGALNEHYQSSI